MDLFFMFLIVATGVVSLAMLYRVYKGPTVYDRLNGLGVIGADTILIIILIGYIDKRPGMYADISLSYAILGFIGLVVIAKYVGKKGDIKE